VDVPRLAAAAGLTQEAIVSEQLGTIMLGLYKLK
jgi:hypothetical protein